MLLVAVVSGCAAPRGTEPLSYQGSPTIGDGLIVEEAAAFEDATGIGFGSIRADGPAAGVLAVVGGEVAIAGVARALTAEERELDAYRRIVAYDAVAVYVHDANPVSALSSGQVHDLLTGRTLDWSEVGGAPEPVEVVIAGEDLEWAVDAGLLGPAGVPDAGALAADARRPAERVRHVAEHPGAVTCASFTFRVPGAKVLIIDGFLPTAEAVRSAEYPFGRPLQLLAHEAPGGSVRRFVRFMLGPEGQAIVAGHRFVPVVR